jgi:hypothetical protein
MFTLVGFEIRTRELLFPETIIGSPRQSHKTYQKTRNKN